MCILNRQCTKYYYLCTLKFKARSLVLSRLIVRPSVSAEQLGSLSKDFHETCNIREFFKYLSKNPTYIKI